ncbi:MAG: DUF167 domain-containing protein [Pelotomaculaceae bacterium]|jgi:uncharacterized protein (TIGR00251 family)|uniref:Uncharacterized protein n=1 Tax=anaerobic digester metagenome TaxID=1263854 RepID=A0A485M3E5_9ZZZZ|nr:DUF167 domain-containing protein [Bacillota bacterium]HHU87172.1 YggU family protein [Peptococcaceae bacterium]
MLNIREDKNGVVFKVRVQPRSSKNQIAGLFDDSLKVRLTAPPVEGEANEACCAFLAKVLAVPRLRVEIAAGQSSRNKLVRVEGLNIEQVLKALGL